MGDNLNVRIPPFSSVPFAVWDRHLQLAALAKRYQGALTQPDHEHSGKLQYIIQTSLDEVQSAICDGCESAKAMYDTLKATYQASSKAALQDLKVKYHSARQEDQEDVQVFAARIKGLASNLAAAGVIMTAQDQTSTFLHGLSAAFETQVTITLNSDELPTITELLPKLMRIQAAKSQSVPTPVTSRAFYTSGNHSSSSSSSHGNHGRYSSRPSGSYAQHNSSSRDSNYHNSSSSNSSGGDPRSCLYCHKPGHVIKDCRSRIAAEQRKNTSNRPSGRVHFGSSKPSGHRSSSSKPSTPKGNHKPVVWMATNSSTNTFGADDDWHFDTGATWHTTGNKDDFVNLKPCDDVIYVANGAPLQAESSGDVLLATLAGDRKLVLRDVRYVPGFTANLLSYNAVKQAGGYIMTDPTTGNLEIWHDYDKIVSLKSHPETGIPFFKAKRYIPKGVTFIAAPKVTYKTWHERLGHLGVESMIQLASKGIVKGFNLTPEEIRAAAAEEVCDACAAGKHTRGPFKISENKTSAPLELLHSDLCGPFNVETTGKSRYFATLQDDYTSFSLVQPLQSKDQVTSFVKQGIAFFETQTSSKVKGFRSDNGREYKNSELSTFLADKGIVHQPSMPYTPEQNGSAERLNRTLLDKAIPMLDASGLELRHWGEAIVCANFLRNRSPVAGKDKVPFEALLNKTPDISNLVPFGCLAYASMPKLLRKTKFDTPAERGIMLGYAPQGQGYRLLTTKGTIIERTSVRFDEKTFPAKQKNVFQLNYGFLPSGAITISYLDNIAATLDIGPPSSATAPTTPQGPAAAAAAPQAPAGPAYNTRGRARQTGNALLTTLDLSEPKTYHEAINSPQKEFWIEAMDSEIAFLRERDTWEIAFPPPGTKTVGCKFVYKVKRLGDGEIERHKARLVAKGFQQIEGVDYNEVFAPVGKYTSFRTLMAKAATEGLIVHNIDISNAFLYGKLKEEIWMDQPEGYHEGESGMACKLKKSIYGLKQAPRVWHLDISEVIQEMSFEPAAADPCLYRYTGTVHHPETYLLIYVDDVAVASKSQETIDALKAYMQEKYKLRDLGEAELFLGISIKRFPTGIKLGQERLINDLVTKYGMEASNGRMVPMSPGIKLTKEEDSPALDTKTYPYSTVVGTLMHLANCTRPDIAYAVGLLARFMSNPKESHWQAAKGVLRYLSGTRTMGLFYSSNGNTNLIGYTDSDFAGDTDTRRSTAGYTFVLANGAISWSSKRQATVATSTTEAEYMASAAAVKEAIWLRSLLNHMGGNETTVMIKGDNQSALALANNPVVSSRAKHVDVAYHFTRERVLLGDVTLSYIPTNEMVADTMTKALPAPQFKMCNAKMGVY